MKILRGQLARCLREADEFLKCSPGTIALSVAVGLVLGVFPMYGVPTALCAIAALALRLNVPALQLMNLLCSPLQLVLVAPFHALGNYVLHSGEPTKSALHASGILQTLAVVGMMALHAIAGWCCAAVPLGIVLYAVMVLALRGWNGATNRTA